MSGEALERISEWREAFGIRARCSCEERRRATATWGTITKITAEQYESTWRVNAFGAFFCAKEVAPNMIERGYGVMLFTGATAGVKAGPRSVAFGRQVCDTLACPSARAGPGAARHSRRFGQHRRRHRYTAVPERFPQFKDDDLLKRESPRPTGIPRIRTAVPGRWN